VIVQVCQLLIVAADAPKWYIAMNVEVVAKLKTNITTHDTRTNK